GVATCAMLGTAPAATSTPARTTAIKARLLDIPPALGCHILLSRARMEQRRLQFQGRAPQTLKCQGAGLKIRVRHLRTTTRKHGVSVKDTQASVLFRREYWSEPRSSTSVSPLCRWRWQSARWRLCEMPVCNTLILCF